MKSTVILASTARERVICWYRMLLTFHDADGESLD